MDSYIRREATVPQSMALRRLDQIVVNLFPEFSRSLIQTWIRSGALLVDGETGRSSQKLRGGENITVTAEIERLEDAPEKMSLDIVYEDSSLLVVNKPAGMVVHPGAGNRSGTLMNGLLHYAEPFSQLPRAGIVHRLDKGTTGLMVVAKTPASQTALIAQLSARSVKRDYQAVVYGSPMRAGTIDAPIGRHRYHRTKMSIRQDGRPAVTHYTLRRQFEQHSLLDISLETGRTHQIRVHMESMGHPLHGDSVYGGHIRQLRGADEETQQFLDSFDRPALHARALTLTHPESGETLSWEIPPPADLEGLISMLARHQETHDQN